MCAWCIFFIGLQRKPGGKIQGHEQFDIRGSVDEFKLFVNMYMFWKPEMEIYVSHVHKRLLPAYVFPNGYRRPGSSKVMPQN